jgi:hypothetical protein
MEASLDLLEPNDLERCLGLAVFPEDVDIPVRVLYEWWGSVYGIGSEAGERLVEDFQRLSTGDAATGERCDSIAPA